MHATFKPPSGVCSLIKWTGLLAVLFLGETATLALAGTSGVEITRIRSDKILYAPGEAGTATVTLRNPTGVALKLELRLAEVTEFDSRRALGSRAVELAAGQELPVAFAFTNSAVEYGRELLVELSVDGNPVATATEPFSVADNVWKVCIGGTPNGPASGSARYSEEVARKQVVEWREQYVNCWEKYFWAPDDWGDLTPDPGATWMSGQARRFENTEKMQAQIVASHQHGIRVVSYGKCMAGGVPGWELARARPQWFVTDSIGRTLGRPADVWDMDHWQDQTLKYDDFKYKWTYRWVDLRRLDALDHGINELLASTRQFAWDGVRFDSGGFRAHWVDGLYNGHDAVNTRNMKRTKERLKEAFPHYLFGYNTDNTAAPDGRAYPLTVAEMSHEMREMLAGGGLWMGEGLKDFANGSVQYTTWSQYARDERRCIQAIKQAGGHTCYLFAADTQPPVCSLYQFVIALMIGSHTYGGEHVLTPGSENWGRFMTRWSGLLWDHRLRPLADAAAAVSVTAARPLWWQEYANERVVSADRRQVVVHLLNPPVNDDLAKTRKKLPKDVLELVHGKSGKTADDLGDDPEDADRPQIAPELLAAARAQQLPPAVKDGVVTLRVPPGQTPRTVWFISPGTPNRAQVAEWKIAGERVSVALPEFAVWAMVVCEFQGTFAEAAATPAFSEPLNGQETAELTRKLPKAVGKVPSFGLRPPAATPNLAVADDLRNPKPQHDPSVAAVALKPVESAVPDGLTVGGEPGLDVLVINGFYHACYRVPEAVRAICPGARLVACTTRDLPKDYPELFTYDLVVLVDMGADAWNVAGQQRLADFVAAGGRLAVLGGPFTLGQGYFKNSPLEQVLPVEVRVARDVYQLPVPLALGAAAGQPFADRPLLYYYHAVTARPDAKPLLWAGELPILWERAVGKGSSVVFAGTPLGEPGSPTEIPFWSSSVWLAGFSRALLGPLAPPGR